MIRKALLLSTTALLLVTLFVATDRDSSDASVPEPARLEYAVPEDGSADVTLAASHVDGLPGCTEITFATSNLISGTLDALADAACAPGATLAGDVSDSATSLPVVTTTGFPDAGTLRIGDELATYTSITDISFGGVTRGAGSTSAAAHSTGDTASQAETENAPLDQNHNDVDTTVVLSGTGLGFPSSGVVQVNDELIAYGSATEVDDTTELGSAVRGAYGSNAAAHQSGDTAFLAVSTSANLSDDIDDTQTNIPLDSVAGLPDPDGAVQINDELITYTGVETTAIACDTVAEPCLTGATRGAGGTNADGHSSGDTAFSLTGVDTDVATTTFTPEDGFFGRKAELTGDITDVAIIIPAAPASGTLANAFPTTGTAVVGDEVFSYTGIDSLEGECDPLPEPCFTGVTRGLGGTDAVAHSTGEMIYQAFFSYTAEHNPTSDAVFVGFDVTPENDPPTAEDVAVNVESSEETANVGIVAEDIDGDSGEQVQGDCELGFSIETEPDHGTLGAIVNAACTSNAPNTDDMPNEDSAAVMYTPDDDYEGNDSFEVMVCDDDSCDTASVDVTVGDVTPTPEPTPTPSPTPSPTPAPTPLPWDFGDMDCDGDVDAVDALAILLVLAGFPPLQPDDPDCPTPGDAPPTPQPTATPSPTPAPTPTPEPTATPTATPV